MDKTMINKNSHIPGCLVALLAALFFTGCMSDYDRSSGRVLDDRGITGKVTSTLNHSPVYKFPHVAVTTYNGVVQLSGFVYKDEQKTEATELAKRVPGVTEVINNISLAPPSATETAASPGTPQGTPAGGSVARDGAPTTGQETNTTPPGSVNR
jgi:hypothetical protein